MKSTQTQNQLVQEELNPDTPIGVVNITAAVLAECLVRSGMHVTTASQFSADVARLSLYKVLAMRERVIEGAVVN